MDAEDVFLSNFLEKLGRFAVKHVFSHFDAFRAADGLDVNFALSVFGDFQGGNAALMSGSTGP